MTCGRRWPDVLGHRHLSRSGRVELRSAITYGLGRDGDLVADGLAAIVVDGATITPSGGVYTVAGDIVAGSLSLSGGAVLAMAGHLVRVMAR